MEIVGLATILVLLAVALLSPAYLPAKDEPKFLPDAKPLSIPLQVNHCMIEVDRLSTLDNSDESRLISMVALHEGFAPYPMNDTKGNETVGYGRNLKARPLSKAAARYLLELDLHDTERELMAVYPDYMLLNSVRRAVLIELAYNMGVTGLMQFRDFLAALKAHDWDKAAYELQDSQWVKDVGTTRAHHLEMLILKGEWQAFNEDVK